MNDIAGVTPLKLHEGQNIWRFIINYASDAFDGLPLNKFIAAIQAEGIPLQHFPLPPLPSDGLFRGYLELAAGSLGLAVNPKDYRSVELPVAKKACNENICFLQQNILMGNAVDIEDIATAIGKVLRCRYELI